MVKTCLDILRILPFIILTKEWHIYVDQSKTLLDRGGGGGGGASGMILDAFCGLSPPSKVQVTAAVLPTTNNKKNKLPWVRIISKVPGKSNMDITNVDSLDKVYRILTKHLQIKVCVVVVVVVVVIVLLVLLMRDC
jgi:hypothetical protein